MGEIIPKPDDVEIPDDRVWEEMPATTRWYYRNKEQQIEWNKQQIEKNKEWLNNIKREKGCKNCDEDEPVCLDFHHTDEKDMEVSSLVSGGYGKNRISNEIEKCVLLCSNCHRKLHSGIIDIEGT